MISSKPQDGIIIDVRTRQEYLNGHKLGAINIPVDDIYHDIDKIDTTNSIVYVYCLSGLRSKRAAHILTSKNINVIDLGGITI